jgi:hypothetical protein
MMKSPFSLENIVSNCYLSLFEIIEQVDFFIVDLNGLFKTFQFYNVLVYDPAHILQNYMTVYE